MNNRREEKRGQSYIEELRRSDTSPQGIILDGQTALALLSRLDAHPRYHDIIRGSITSGFGLEPKETQILYSRAQRAESFQSLPGDPERKRTITTHNIKTIFVPSDFPDTVVVTAWSLTDTNHDGITAPKPQDSTERMVAVLQKVNPDDFLPTSNEEKEALHQIGLLHASETYLAGVAARLQPIPPRTQQQQDLWIAVLSAEAWEAALQDAKEIMRRRESSKRGLFDFLKKKPSPLPPIMGLDDSAIVRIPGTVLLSLDTKQNTVNKRERPQQYPPSNAPAVAEKIETYLAQQ